MKQVEQLLSYIQSNGKHGLYQLLPPALINKYEQLKTLPYKNVRLDDQRFDYFTSKLDFTKANITDIGANIGYFSFRLATEKQCSVNLYEPYIQHYKALKVIEELLNIQKNCNIYNKGISLDDIEQMDNTDILLFFNVLQHAGEDFDKKYVKTKSDWEAHAVSYLSKLRDKTKYLVFQNGYSWLGHEEEFCDKKDIIRFTLDLLQKAGWTTLNCGIITDFHKKEYRDLDINKTTNNPINSKLKYLEYGIKYRLGLDVPNLTFIQRPIFICQS
ncbi:DUF1698 domain-containing protein [Carboxylicivirga linearis]|uniref:DUF1698 domain-containing protein n=1 Tax=Carboxylicivirga linearis TaxID=1628157 RepID=A0ABS5JV19_9BACT|nr:DUF1698 domain-containing protein [Carboxylicivirga linearis]MBS2098745.1 DUF1698 domain-containing protein [Carboxylicivirga linearis]